MIKNLTVIPILMGLILLQRNNESERSPETENVRIPRVWSEWGDSNARPPAPKAGALPTAQHPDKTELHYT